MIPVTSFGSIYVSMRMFQPTLTKQFLNMIDQHFQKFNKPYPIFNRNTVKVSYSYTQNISGII